MTETPPQSVHLYVFDGFVDWEAAFAVGSLNDPQFQRHPGRWQVRTVAATGAPVRSMGGMQVQPDLALAELSPADSALLILPGGPGWLEDDRHGPTVALALRRLAEQRPVAAICGATAGLARAGALDTRQHTSNALAYLKGTGYRGSDRYVDQPALIDQHLITAGGMAPVEFAREILALLDVYNPAALEAWFELYKQGHSRSYARLAEAAQRDG